MNLPNENTQPSLEAQPRDFFAEPENAIRREKRKRNWGRYGLPLSVICGLTGLLMVGVMLEQPTDRFEHVNIDKPVASPGGSVRTKIHQQCKEIFNYNAAHTQQTATNFRAIAAHEQGLHPTGDTGFDHEVANLAIKHQLLYEAAAAYEQDPTHNAASYQSKMMQAATNKANELSSMCLERGK